jgi:hypothetical protein
MIPEDQGTDDAWRVRHPVAALWLMAVLWLILFAIISYTFWPLIRSLTYDWETWKLIYEMEDETWLHLELPSGPPVVVDKYVTSESCEADRAEIVRRAYQHQQAIPPLSCARRYPGWRRLWQTLRTMSDTFEK